MTNNIILDEAELLPTPPANLQSTWNYNLDTLNFPDDYNELLLKLLASPNIAGKGALFQQIIGRNDLGESVTNWSSVAVIKIEAFNNVGLTLGSFPRYCFLDPRRGAAIAMAGMARRLVCAGLQPVNAGICLNNGIMDTPESHWSLEQCKQGLEEARQSLGISAVSRQAVEESHAYPVPVIGMAGLANTLNSYTGPGFKDEGDLIFLLGDNLPELGGSEYLKLHFGLEVGKPPALNLLLEKRVQAFVLKEISNELIKSAQPCCLGGLGAALAESCIAGDIGADITMVRRFRGDTLLFGETQSRIVVSVDSKQGVELVKKLVEGEIPFTQLGKVSGSALIINVVNPGCTGCGGNLVNLPVSKMKETWRGAIECLTK
ncbi:hypothetical protein N752_07545 [Desulforamulus aquiferis]|nr:AIR synthase-related protein [Desulforamulus aquiferis]RYD05739.1 hypothetical protein N752_07545 [Desulforamulus aquiferis]